MTPWQQLKLKATCPECGCSFITNHESQQYCSTKCYNGGGRVRKETREVVEKDSTKTLFYYGRDEEKYNKALIGVMLG